MKKIFKSKKVLIGVTAVILLVITIFFVVFFKENNNDKLKGSIAEITNYSDGFTDVGFYSCVVNAYNLENNTDYGIDDKLTNEQLASIKTLTCNTSGDKYKYDITNEKITGYAHTTGFEEEIDYYKDSKFLPYTDEFYTDYFFANYEVENVDGIDKLTGLESFTSYINSAQKIDLSKNLSLKHLDLHTKSSVTEIDLTNNLELTNLLVDMYQSTKIIGLENLFNLTELYIYEETVNNLTTYNYYEELSNLVNLKKLTLRNTKFYEMGIIKDLENLEELSIYIGYNENSQTNLSELKSLLNLKSLYYGGPYQLLGDLPDEFPNLEELNLKGMYSNYMYPRDFSTHILELDLSRFKNVKRLYIPTDYWFDDWGDGWTLYKNTSILKNFDKLVNLEYLNANWETFDNIKDMTKLKTLVTTKTATITNKQDSIETIYGSLKDYSNVPNLKKLYNTKMTTSTTNYSIIENLQELYLESSTSNTFSSITNFNNLEEFHYPSYTNFDISLLYNSKKLKKLSADRGYITLKDDSNEIDLSNNEMLETIVLYSQNSYSYGEYLVGLENLKDLKHCHGCMIKTNSLSGNEKLEYLDLIRDEDDYATISFKDNKNLRWLNLMNANYDKVDLSNNKNIEYLKVSVSSYDKLDVSKLSNLKFFHTNYISSYSKSIMLNKKTNIYGELIFPNHYKVIISDNDIIEYRDGNLYGKEIGDTSISVKTYNTKPESARFCKNYSSLLNCNSYTLYIYVKDMMANKQTINNEDAYIFTNGLIREKSIINDLYFLPVETMGDFYGFVDRNNYKIYNYKDYVDQYKLIKVTSDLYKVESDIIRYYGDFNLDRVRVTNAEKELQDNKLIIKYNGKVVKEYNLIQDYSIIGDVNSDGEITISDLILQYKHVNYLLELNSNDLYRADINSDEDVEHNDVNLLYDVVKKGN